MYNPTKEELIKDLKKHNWVKSHLAESKGVDESSIRRACKRLKIDTVHEARQGKTPLKYDDYSLYIQDKVIKEPKIVLAFGDFHSPFQHPDYLDFLNDVKKRFKCDYFVCTGDEIDNHAISFHPHDPDGFSANEELDQAMKYMKLVYKMFPVVDSCISNHTSRPFRQAYANGLPMRFMRSYNEFMEAPRTWEWRERFVINDVVYQHGTNYSGDTGHLKAAINNRQSTVIGHIHSGGGVNYSANFNDLIFGANTGCGLDIRAYAFHYAANMGKKPVLGCCVVREGKEAIFVPMNLGNKVRYER